MTKVTVFRSNGHIVGFLADGHSGYADEGYDIVCSAVSALTQTAVMGLVEVLKLSIATEIKDGELYCMLDKNIDEESLYRAEIIFKTMMVGLSSIAETYSDHLKLVDKEV